MRRGGGGVMVHIIFQDNPEALLRNSTHECALIDSHGKGMKKRGKKGYSPQTNKFQPIISGGSCCCSCCSNHGRLLFLHHRFASSMRCWLSWCGVHGDECGHSRMLLARLLAVSCTRSHTQTGLMCCSLWDPQLAFLTTLLAENRPDL